MRMTRLMPAEKRRPYPIPPTAEAISSSQIWCVSPDATIRVCPQISAPAPNHSAGRSRTPPDAIAVTPIATAETASTRLVINALPDPTATRANCAPTPR
jgi:hypothetical protein